MDKLAVRPESKTLIIDKSNSTHLNFSFYSNWHFTLKEVGEPVEAEKAVLFWVVEVLGDSILGVVSKLEGVAASLAVVEADFDLIY